MKILLKVFMLFLSIAWVGCTPEIIDETYVTAYIKDADHGLTQQVISKGYAVQATYKPSDLLISQELGHQNEGLDILRLKYDGQSYFMLYISRDDKEALDKNGERYSELINTLSFRMPGYVSLITSKRDTLEVLDYVFPRTYGYGASTNLMFAFSNEKIAGSDWLDLYLRDFGLGMEDHTFRFSMEDIKNIPAITWPSDNQPDNFKNL